MTNLPCAVLLLLGVLTNLAWADGRLLATGGASSIEGAAGGGITPWAVLSGYGERGEWGADVFATRVETGDYRLDVAGVGASFDNRIELSYARQRFDLGTLAHNLNLPENSLSQDIFGLKVRLFGDLIYEQLPQVSVGIQHKRQKDFLIPSLIGAQRSEDTEGYISASRFILGGAFGYNLLLNGGVRYSRANELGCLVLAVIVVIATLCLKRVRWPSCSTRVGRWVWSTARNRITSALLGRATGLTCFSAISPTSIWPWCWPMHAWARSPRWIIQMACICPCRGVSRHAYLVADSRCPNAGCLCPAAAERRQSLS